MPRKTKLIRVGQVFETNKSGRCKVIQYVCNDEVLIRFIVTGTEVWCRGDALVRGQIKDRNFPSVFGVGCIGYGPYNSTSDGTRDKDKAYVAWVNMLKRTHCPKELAKNPSYADVRVHTSFLSFQRFAKWYYAQPHWDDTDMNLDKDLRVPGSKLYGPKTCALVPQAVNKIVVDGGSKSKTKNKLGVWFCSRTNNYMVTVRDGAGNGVYVGVRQTKQEAHLLFIKAKRAIVAKTVKSERRRLHPEVRKSLLKWPEGFAI